MLPDCVATPTVGIVRAVPFRPRPDRWAILALKYATMSPAWAALRRASFGVPPLPSPSSPPHPARNAAIASALIGTPRRRAPPLNETAIFLSPRKLGSEWISAARVPQGHAPPGVLQSVK